MGFAKIVIIFFLLEREKKCLHFLHYFNRLKKSLGVKSFCFLMKKGPIAIQMFF